jgi:hypothetical protein
MKDAILNAIIIFLAILIASVSGYIIAVAM